MRKNDMLSQLTCKTKPKISSGVLYNNTDIRHDAHVKPCVRGIIIFLSSTIIWRDRWQGRTANDRGDDACATAAACIARMYSIRTTCRARMHTLEEFSLDAALDPMDCLGVPDFCGVEKRLNHGSTECQ
jgi:hypothetical protein